MKHMISFFHMLPHELVDIIVSYLTYSSKYAFSLVSKFCNRYKITYREDNFPETVISPYDVKKRLYWIIIADTVCNSYTKIFVWLMDNRNRKIWCENKVINRTGVCHGLWPNEDTTYLEPLCIKAAVSGSYDIIKHIFENYNGTVIDPVNILKAAAKSGHFKILKYVYKVSTKYLFDTQFKYHEKICEGAAEGGHVDILEWLIKKDYPIHKQAFINATHCGHLHVLQSFHRYIHYNQTLHIWTTAAEGGHMAILRWLSDTGRRPDEYGDVYDMAAKHGHFKVLKFLLDSGKNGLSPHTCMYAARNGHFDILKYLLKEGCPYDARVCAFAAMGGHLGIVKWLIENGYLWDESEFWYSSYIQAADNGRLDILKWLHTIKPITSYKYALHAIMAGHFEVFKWLDSLDKYTDKKELDPELDSWCTTAAIQGRFDILIFLHDEKKCKLNVLGCENRAQLKLHDFIKWFRNNGYPLVGEKFYDETCEHVQKASNYVKILEWLKDKQ